MLVGCRSIALLLLCSNYCECGKQLNYHQRLFLRMQETIDRFIPHQKLIFFGDSITDDGQDPPRDLYGYHRLCNGNTWQQYLTQFLGVKVEDTMNYAYDGATSGYINAFLADWSGILWQIDEYVKSKPDKRHHTIAFLQAGGANDFILELLKLTESGPNFLETVVENTVTGAHRLLDAGVSAVFILELLDVSNTPIFTTHPYNLIKTASQQLVAAANRRLQQKVVELQRQLKDSEAHVILLEQEQIGNSIAESFAVRNKTLDEDRANYNYEDIPKYAFYDQFHPSSAAHKLMAEHLLQQVQNSGVMD